MPRKKASKLRNKEGWLTELESIANDRNRDDRARLAALKEIGEIQGFKQANNFALMSTADRLRHARLVVVPVLRDLFGIEVEDDGGEADAAVAV